jgi:NAD(P)-dependent dehydrogenase (short-subunit alcohol dehydrogenase family)
MNAHQRTAIITGASSGIGLTVAEIFVREGINVVLNGRTEDKLVRVASQINQPDRVTIITADITLPGTAKQIVNKAVKSFGQVDILVNNAGIFYSKPFIAYTVEELDTFLGYLRGTFVLTQAVVRQMQKQGRGGSIVNIGTILTSSGVYDLPSSAPITAKGGIMALTKNLSAELAPDNIRINAVAPGIILTPILGKLSDKQLATFNRMQPLGRCGTPKEIANAVLYLANSTWTTGVIIPVDGGINASGDGAYHRVK